MLQGYEDMSVSSILKRLTEFFKNTLSTTDEFSPSKLKLIMNNL